MKLLLSDCGIRATKHFRMKTIDSKSADDIFLQQHDTFVLIVRRLVSVNTFFPASHEYRKGFGLWVFHAYI